ncbi:MAG: DUF2332 domain-containing protein, partial [Cellvibrionaceae bacterium]|nr:DUF2332 domain-containing protein [Cellvibrionaceae bacterium]
MRWTELEDHFLQQGQSCRQLGSPFYGELMPLLSQSICRHSALGRALLCWPMPARESALALRIAAALHYLFLAGKPGPVAALYRGGGQAKAGLLHQALAEHENHILDCIQSPPQTNEIGRSLALLIGALAIAEKGSNQLDLYELGSSAGLNLNFDHYLFQAQTWYWGQADSPVTIHSKISGSPADARFEIGRRWGCDLNPIHV